MRTVNPNSEASFEFSLEDMRELDRERFIIDTGRGRIVAREGARKCFHGRALYYQPATKYDTKRIPTYCAMCEFEIELLSRKPSDRP